MSGMRGYGFSRYGGPDVEGFLDLPEPRAAVGSVLIRMLAGGVNPGDIKVRAGERHGKFAVSFPMAMGREAAGEVLDDPSGTFAAGEVVFGSCVAGTGAFAELALLDVAQAARVTTGVDPVQAACIPVGIGTAWDALVELGVGPGTTVLVLGAGGGVGIHAVQLARRLGATALGLARGDKLDLVAEHGGVPLDSNQDWKAEASRLAASGATAVIDAVGGELLVGAAGLVVDTGRIRSAADPELAARLGGAAVTRRRTTAVYAELAALVVEGSLRPVIERVHRFDDAASATASVAAGHGAGKIALLGPTR